ncbi:MAG: O-methyltransferase [Bradymonadia bacterium]|jgi:predicted O-methyltransferase YrrM
MSTPDRLSQLPDRVQRVIDEVEAFCTGRDDAWEIPRREGEILHQITLSLNAQRVVEVGTSFGFSGLFFASALERTGGTLDTIDPDPRKFEAATSAFQRAGLDARVRCHLGRAQEVLPGLEGPFDLVFIDADKGTERVYFELVWSKVRVGGAVLVDNVSTHRAALQPYLDFVHARTDARSVELPVGNGVEWTVKCEAFVSPG